MTTTLPRFTVTETPELARTIDLVLLSYDDLRDSRQAALKRIILAGSAAIERERDEVIAQRRAAISHYAGSLTGVFPPDAAKLLREEWPE